MNDPFDYSFEKFQINNSYWQRYDNLVSQMSSEQRTFVSKQKSVLDAKQSLMSTFIDFLFEREKASFVNSSDDAKKIADNYLNAIKEASERYVTRNEELEKENMELKKQLKQLMLDFEDKKNESNSSAAK